VKIFVGVPGSSAAAGSGYIPPSQLEIVITSVMGQENFGGVMMWYAIQSLQKVNWTGILIKRFRMFRTGSIMRKLLKISSMDKLGTILEHHIPPLELAPLGQASLEQASPEQAPLEQERVSPEQTSLGLALLERAPLGLASLEQERVSLERGRASLERTRDSLEQTRALLEQTRASLELEPPSLEPSSLELASLELEPPSLELASPEQSPPEHSSLELSPPK
jgi:hypothetical protein